MAVSVKLGATAALITMLRLAVAISGAVSESLTPTVKLELPAEVGVPEMTPVLALSVSPAGKLPLLMLQV